MTEPTEPAPPALEPALEPAPETETEALRQRYARRRPDDPRYHPLDAAALWARQERERALRGWLVEPGAKPVAALCAIEVGCGDGNGLLDLMRLGFDPARLAGVELLAERHALARWRLPQALRLWCGDATLAEVGDGAWDLVFVSTVFSSLLDPAFQRTLADALWRWLRPGGAVVCYDFAVDNPRNPDVRGVPVQRLRELFPQGRMRVRRVTLAPPLARTVARVHPALITLLNALPLLRTHRLAWIEKPE